MLKWPHSIPSQVFFSVILIFAFMKVLKFQIFFLCCIVSWSPPAQQLYLDLLQSPEMLQQTQMLSSVLIFHQKLLRPW